MAPKPPQKGLIALGQGSTKDPSHRETEGTDTSDVRKPRVVLVKEASVQQRFDFTSLCFNTTLNPAPKLTYPSTPRSELCASALLTIQKSVAQEQQCEVQMQRVCVPAVSATCVTG